MTDTAIAKNIAKLRERIRIASQNCGRDADSVTLLAVSKTRPAAAVRAAAAAGLCDIGENYLQEALEKMDALADLPLRWHFIGPLQSNKTRDVAQRFDWVHSVDRLKIARRLNDQRPPELPPLNVCLQVNISQEASKAGLVPEQVADLAAAVADMSRLQLRGLMAIPAPPADGSDPRAPFAALRQLMASLAVAHPGLDTLSMGMSADMEAAIAEGATIVRIGTDIFGARTPG
ncbi:MAG: YggS family pyridoxal phosphate-dependent enzyme [Halieaceae bacterium]|nr:YggS family pyridoxal phosphate-dependent enzyme [Halieaceae bacterium]